MVRFVNLVAPSQFTKADSQQLGEFDHQLQDTRPLTQTNLDH